MQLLQCRMAVSLFGAGFNNHGCRRSLPAKCESAGCEANHDERQGADGGQVAAHLRGPPPVRRRTRTCALSPLRSSLQVTSLLRSGTLCEIVVQVARWAQCARKERHRHTMPACQVCKHIVAA